MSAVLGAQCFEIQWVDQKMVCIGENWAMMSHQGRSPDNLLCWSVLQSNKRKEQD